VLLIGVPAAGKSTLYRERFSTSHVRLSGDEDAARTRKERAAEARRLLRAGTSVVIDDTNVSAETRAPFIAAARETGARVIGYVFEVSIKAAVARNAQRASHARVPDVAIFTSAKRLQPPTLVEGFDELYVVRLEPDGRAVVSRADGSADE
jgi:predicted kinase